MASHKISLTTGGPNPNTLTVESGDEVTLTNTTEIYTLDLSFSDGAPVTEDSTIPETLAPNESFTVTIAGDEEQSYSYSYNSGGTDHSGMIVVDDVTGETIIDNGEVQE